MCKYFKTKNIFYSISLIVVVMLLTSLHFSFRLDESFTYGLIVHSYSNIINLDTMDVHPPFYYLLLKLFISVFTFWTKSVFIKVIFARLLSLISLIIFIWIMNKLVLMFNPYKAYNFSKLQVVIFLLLPSIIPYATNIRMYSLAATFLLIEIYELLKFDKSDKWSDLLIATLFTIFSIYTFYFSGLSAGIFLLIFIFKYIKNMQWIHLRRVIISCLLIILAYIPWVPYLLHQVIYHRNTDNGLWKNSLLNIPGAIFNSPSLIISLVGIIVFGLLIVFSLKFLNKKFNKLLFILLINEFITIIISFIISGKQFQSKISYPINSILCFVILSVIPLLMKNKNYNKYVIMPFLLIISLVSLIHIYVNINKYDIPSWSLIRQTQIWKYSNKSNIVINKFKYPISKQMTASEDAIYLKPYNKNVQINNYTYKNLSEGLLNNNKNLHLIKNIFNNIKINN